MKETQKKAKGTQKKAQESPFHVMVGKTDYEISEARKKELAFTDHALSRDEIATKSTPEPFGP